MKSTLHKLNIVELLKKSQLISKKINGRNTGEIIENIRQIYINDKLKILFLKHFNEDAHPIGHNFTSSINHYNIEVHQLKNNNRWKQIYNVHIIYNIEDRKWFILE